MASTSGPAKTPLTEVRDDEAILNFIFDPKKAFIGAAMPDLPAGAGEALVATWWPEHATLRSRRLASNILTCVTISSFAQLDPSRPSQWKERPPRKVRSLG